MKQLLLSLTAISAILAGPAAFAADESYKSETNIERDDDGSYTKTTTEESTDANGTDIENEATVSIEKNADGSIEKEVNTEATHNPSGLFNKSSVETTDKVKKDADGDVEAYHQKKVNGKVVEEKSSKY